MKDKIKIIARIFICMAITLISVVLLSITVSADVEIGFSTHNLVDNTGYFVSDTNKVSTYCTGQTRLGQLAVIGDASHRTYQGFEAVAVYGDDVYFRYYQKFTNVNYGGHLWMKSLDSASSIAGYYTGTISSGALIVLKSTDGVSWQKETSIVNIDGKAVTFIPDGKDIQNGVYYRFISALEVLYEEQTGSKKVWDSPFHYHTEAVYSQHYENLSQVSTVYVASDSCEVGFYSQATEDFAVPNLDEVSVENLEVIKKGTSLTNNSISFNQIRVDKLGNKSFDITCSFNDGKPFAVEDGKVFRDSGKYHFTVKTKFGTKKETDLWILHPGDDMAYSQYFGDSFVSQDKRMFDKTSSLPVYAVGSTLNIAPAENVPGLTGNIYRFADASALEADQYEVFYAFNWQTEKISISLNETGIYCADLYTGDPTCCGEFIHYGFYLMVSPSDGYKPMINYEMLTSADRHVMLQTSAHAVNFPTAGGGCYIFMFPATTDGYEAALAFSEEAELRFVEEYVQNGVKAYYYKGHGSSGLKQYFASKIELQEAVYRYAQDNVILAHILPTEAYATMTLDEVVANVENTSIRKDVRVCVDAKTRDALLANTIVLNGYSFQQVADYETDSVVAVAENGTVYSIPYDTDIATILPATGRYTIRESNWNGIREYEAVFFAHGEVTGEIELSGYKDFQSFSETVCSSTSNKVIEGYKIVLISGEDPYDSETLVTIETLGKRTVMALSEIEGFTINEPGDYTLTITNRCGYSTITKFKINEPPKVTIHFDGYERWNRTATYGEPLGDLPVAEQFGNCFVGWTTTDGTLVAEATICDWRQSDIYLIPSFKAQEIEVVFSYFEGYDKLQSAYGSIINLPIVDDIEDLFAFGYWELDGQIVEGETMTVSTLNNIVFVAKYYKIENGLPIKTVSYTASEIPLMAMKYTSRDPLPATTNTTDSSRIIKVDEYEPMPKSNQDQTTLVLVIVVASSVILFTLIGCAFAIVRAKKLQ